MSKNRTKNIAVAAVVVIFVFALGVFTIDWLWPRFDHWLFRIGLTSPISVSETQVSMQDSWYLSMSSEKGMGKWFLKSPRPTAIARKLSSNNQGMDFVIAISKISDQEAEKMMAPGPHITGTKIFPWGTAMILVGNRAVFVPEYGIVISDDDRLESYLFQALEDIRSVRRLH